MWRTPDTPDNAAAFAKPGTQHGETAYPQVRMLCQMELTSHLLVQAVMENCAVNEMVLAEQLLKSSPQARKKWSQLPDTVEARLLTR